MFLLSTLSAGGVVKDLRETRKKVGSVGGGTLKGGYSVIVDFF